LEQEFTYCFSLGFAGLSENLNSKLDSISSYQSMASLLLVISRALGMYFVLFVPYTTRPPYLMELLTNAAFPRMAVVTHKFAVYSSSCSPGSELSPFGKKWLISGIETLPYEDTK